MAILVSKPFTSVCCLSKTEKLPHAAGSAEKGSHHNIFCALLSGRALYLSYLFLEPSRQAILPGWLCTVIVPYCVAACQGLLHITVDIALWYL